jgi:hypothetical protein
MYYGRRGMELQQAVSAGQDAIEARSGRIV